MAKGYILLHRQIWDNKIWKRSEPFDGRSAWIDLLLMANHADNESIRGMSVIKIKRGQIHTSIVNLAKRWHWSRGKVNRYLLLLSEQQMVQVDSTTNGTTLTIVKYEVFQDWRTTNDTTSSTTNDTTNGTTSGSLTKNVLKNDTKNERMNEGKKSYKRPSGDRSSSLKAWEELERRIEGNG